MASKKIAVYCGSRLGNDPAFAAAARELGHAIGERGYTLVYGGGRIGLMGVVADAVMASGGHTYGVMPQFLVDREQAHHGLDELVIVDTMQERKAKMLAAGEHFVALPGGVGTFEEIFEALSWRHLNFTRGSVAMYNVKGCYDAAAALFQMTLDNGFLPADEHDILKVTNRLEEITELWEKDCL